MLFNLKRVQKLNQKESGSGPVVYWMSREQRVQDNWGLIFAQKLANQKATNLVVVFVLQKEFLGANPSHFGFMLEGLKEVEVELTKLNIPFYLLEGAPEVELPKFIEKYSISELVSDFSPLKIKLEWNKKIFEEIKIPFYHVDSRNIIPAWIISPKLEFAAYTIRPKIHKLLPEYLTEYTVVSKQDLSWNNIVPKIVWEGLIKDSTIKSTFTSGASSANQLLTKFIDHKLDLYGDNRNDPNLDGQSGLSPYLHFGQISSQRIALEVFNKLGLNESTPSEYKQTLISKILLDTSSQASFLEELIVRRELSDNFCLYNSNYDNFEGFHDWAKKSLNEHRADKREYIYSLEEFEQAKTHDDLWNAAQKEMIQTGKMHGFMRMYWAKKILEWTGSPETALKIAIYLNDKYSLDGRDPNGYAGISWSIGGVHDRAWNERPVFGKIRYMNYNGCKRKFDVVKYIDKFSGARLF
ncbi:MAG: deoxyribodipyrimidine photo-lyase [bacterium]